jgi:hypothetical protein
MKLLEKIKNDLVSAMKSKNEAETDILQMLVAALKNEKIAKGDELSEEEEIKTIFKESKKVKDSIEQYKKADREDLVKREREQLKIIMNYLPEQADEDKIKEVVEETIDEVGAESLKDMGRVMGAVMGKLEGKAEGGQVSAIVKQKLS